LRCEGDQLTEEPEYPAPDFTLDWVEIEVLVIMHAEVEREADRLPERSVCCRLAHQRREVNVLAAAS